MNDDISRLVDDVAKQRTVVNSTKTLIERLQGQVAELSSKLGLALQNNDAGLTQQVQQQLQALAADLEANTNDLAAAVPQNTPSAQPANAAKPD